MMKFQDGKGIDVQMIEKDVLIDMRELEEMEKTNPELVSEMLKNPQNWRIHKRGDVIVENVYTEGKTINDLFGVLVMSS
ncbi:MAG: hypothetical protein LUD18_01120 [Lachnospiraceae bacterium]|nr:hypothetical protein [Lachnospiraceae bacterium]